MRFRLATLICLAATPAVAHPHVWVGMESSVVVNATGQVEALKIEWTFDDNYTVIATEGLDTDGDGSFSSEELAPLTKENIASLKEYDYFTSVHQKDAKLKIGEVKEFGQVYQNGKLKLYFSVPLAVPVDPKAGTLDIRVYDPDFFIAFDYETDDAATLEGSLSPGCAMTLEALKTDEELDQTREMLSSKGQDWTPDVATDFGAMFARPIKVTCAAS
jgi:ABC-type uncharacterized transport system substrate-binding protein